MAQVLLLFSYVEESAARAPRLAALVRWYCAAAHTRRTALTGMQRLRWETAQRGGERVPRCDVVAADSILGPACIQRDCSADTEEPRFFFNPYLRARGGS